MTSAGWKTVMTGTGLTLFVCSMWRLPFCTTKRDVNFRSLKGNLIPTRRRFGIQGELTSSFCSRSEGEVSTGANRWFHRETWNEKRIHLRKIPCEASMSQLEPQFLFGFVGFLQIPPMPWVKSWSPGLPQYGEIEWDRGRHWKSSQLIGNCTPFGFPKKMVRSKWERELNCMKLRWAWMQCESKFMALLISRCICKTQKSCFFLGQEMAFIFCCPKRTSLMKRIDGHFERWFRMIHVESLKSW